LDFFIFLQIILFLFITPGLPRIVIVSHTINYGLKRSVWTALGDISANILQGVLVVFVTGTLLKNNPEALNLLKWAGIFYIIYLAYDTYTTNLKPFDNRVKKFKTKFFWNNFFFVY
jgi:homoserine/homoserine lactone efflux protein